MVRPRSSWMFTALAACADAEPVTRAFVLEPITDLDPILAEVDAELAVDLQATDDVQVAEVRVSAPGWAVLEPDGNDVLTVARAERLTVRLAVDAAAEGRIETPLSVVGPEGEILARTTLRVRAVTPTVSAVPDELDLGAIAPGETATGTITLSSTTPFDVLADVTIEDPQVAAVDAPWALPAQGAVSGTVRLTHGGITGGVEVPVRISVGPHAVAQVVIRATQQ